jgi:hypothetical protein
MPTQFLASVLDLAARRISGFALVVSVEKALV